MTQIKRKPKLSWRWTGESRAPIGARGGRERQPILPRQLMACRVDPGQNLAIWTVSHWMISLLPMVISHLLFCVWPLSRQIFNPPLPLPRYPKSLWFPRLPPQLGFLFQARKKLTLHLRSHHTLQPKVIWSGASNWVAPLWPDPLPRLTY